jgi:hypothetical protein
VRRIHILVLALALFACASGNRHIVPLLETAGVPLTETPHEGTALEVVTRSTAVDDPLTIKGSSIVYGEIEPALGFAISSATVPWATTVKPKRQGGFQLLAEVVQAYVEYEDGRLMVILNVRATLRARVGNTYIAQVASRCREAAVTPPEKGAPVVYTCMSRIGRDLSGWLGGLEL